MALISESSISHVILDNTGQHGYTKQDLETTRALVNIAMPKAVAIDQMLQRIIASDATINYIQAIEHAQKQDRFLIGLRYCQTTRYSGVPEGLMYVEGERYNDNTDHFSLLRMAMWIVAEGTVLADNRKVNAQLRSKIANTMFRCGLYDAQTKPKSWGLPVRQSTKIEPLYNIYPCPYARSI